MKGIGREDTGGIGTERTDIARRNFEEIDKSMTDAERTDTGVMTELAVEEGTAVRSERTALPPSHEVLRIKLHTFYFISNNSPYLE